MYRVFSRWKARTVFQREYFCLIQAQRANFW